MNSFRILLAFVVIFSTFSCAKKNDKDNDINVFSLKQDKEIGAEVDAEYLSNPEYIILKEEEYPEAYNMLKSMRNRLLTSDNLNHATDFDWTVRIIKNDTILNAFCTPGGYMYFYTGLITYLENEAQFAGVVAHEMCHADRRHVTDRLTTLYGVSIVLNLIIGKDPGTIKEIARDLALGLGNLKFSRENEYEADEYAVKYLQDAGYNPLGIRYFFDKLIQEGSVSRMPEFLSTHPNPENRIENIVSVWESLGSPTGDDGVDSYQAFKISLGLE